MSGGVFATVAICAKWQWLHEQAQGGEPNRLSAAHVQRLCSCVGGYDPGWKVKALPDACQKRVCLLHSGMVEGFSAYSLIVQDGKAAISAFTNTEGQGVDADRVLRLLVMAIFGLRGGLGLIARERQLAGGESVSAKLRNGSAAVR